MDAARLKSAIDKDRNSGHVPIMVVATAGGAIDLYPRAPRSPATKVYGSTSTPPGAAH
jgi:hypothetical protein